jgi:hypothetical protein
MGIKFDPECQAAVDIAKQALSDGAELDAGTLLASLYYRGNLKSKYPLLEKHLPRPAARRPDVPEKVSLAPELRPVFQKFATRESPVARTCRAQRMAFIGNPAFSNTGA